MECRPDRTWAEIDLDRLVYNFKQFISITQIAGSLKQAKVMAVVKANAYGHGAVTVAKTLAKAGAGYLAVATLNEAVELRDAGISLPLMVLNYVAPQRSMELLRHGVTATVCSPEAAEILSDAAIRCEKKAKVHIKIDTGMTRVGMNWNTACEGVKTISKMPGLEIEGIFTHFSSADESDHPYTEMQFERYMCVVEALKKNGIEIPIKHVCNSAAAINYPWMHLDMIRPGISLYGCYPAGEQGIEKQKIEIKPVMSLRTEVIRVNEVDAGVCVSYGREYETTRKSRLATIPVGYADGFTRLLFRKAFGLINGHKAPIVGRICMDQCVMDVTDMPGGIGVGDTVTLLGEHQGSRIAADDLAASIGTNNYEILCMVGRRVPRYYYRGCELVGTENYLLGEKGSYCGNEIGE